MPVSPFLLKEYDEWNDAIPPCPVHSDGPGGGCGWLHGDIPGAAEPARPVFCCASDNDLYRVLVDCRLPCPRFDNPMAAVQAAPDGAGVLHLADQYPEKPQTTNKAVFERAAKKRLRLYVEYASRLPGIEVGPPCGINFERGLTTSEALGAKLKPMRIVAIHDCHFVPTTAPQPHITLAKVAGLETAVYGLPKETGPILFEHPGG